MNLVIRADASAAQGFGHVARACAVADAVVASGGTANLVVGGGAGGTPGPALAFARGLGHAASPPSPRDADDLLTWAARLNAAILIDGVAGLVPSLLTRSRVALLDDMGTADAPVEWLINHNHGAEDLAPSYRSHQKLLGRRYLLLRHAVLARGHGACTPRWRTRLRVTIAFGGSDPVGATAHVVAALPARPLLDAIVVTGPGFAADAALTSAMRAAARRGHAIARIHAPSDLPALLASSDAAITAAGGMVGELAYLGCPTCAYAIVADQRRVARRLAADGLIHGGLALEGLGAAGLTANLTEFLTDEGRRESLRAAALATADGAGADRVVAALGAAQL